MVFVPESIWPKVEVSNFYLYYTAHIHTAHTLAAAAEIWEIVAYFSAAAVGLTELLFVCFIAWHRHFAVDWVKASPPSAPPFCLSPLCFLPFKLRNWELCKAKEEKLHRKPKLFIVPRIASSPPPSPPLSSPHSLFCLYLYWALSRIQAECRIVALSGHLAFQ